MSHIEDNPGSGNELGTADVVEKFLKAGLFNPLKNQIVESLLAGFFQSYHPQTPTGFLEFMDSQRADPVGSTDQEEEMIRSMTCRDILLFAESMYSGIQAEHEARQTEETSARQMEWMYASWGIFREAALMEMRRDQFRKHYK